MGYPPVHKALLREEAGGGRYLNVSYRPTEAVPIEGREVTCRSVEGPTAIRWAGH